MKEGRHMMMILVGGIVVVVGLIQYTSRSFFQRDDRLDEQERQLTDKEYGQGSEEDRVLPLACSLPSDIHKTMRHSSRSGFDRYVPDAPEIDDQCIRNYLQDHQDYCERFMIPRWSNVVEYQTSGVLSTDKPMCLCPCVPEHLNGRVNLILNETKWMPTSRVYLDAEREVKNATLKGLKRWPGGRWTPSHCVPRSRLAMIITYSEREKHLKIFINHIVPLLKRQRVDFQIFVIEQIEPEMFGKTHLLNIGFIEARKRADFDCYVFHDVDLFPLDDRHFYGCRTEAPKHFTAHLDKHKYTPIYLSWFGGVVAFTREQFERVNGYGIKYYGWGGEDDDMYQRVTDKHYNRTRPPQCVSLYNSIRHSRDKRFPTGPFAYTRDGFKHLPDEYGRLGLRQTNYTLLETVDEKLYTKLMVVIPPPPPVESKGVFDRLPESIIQREGFQAPLMKFKNNVPK